MTRVKRDITRMPREYHNTPASRQVEIIINKYGDKFQPIWEKMREEIEALGYKIHVETATSDGKLEVGYYKK